MINISIVTVNLNDAEGLDRTLKSISFQKYAAIESIVIDGGSIDGSCDVIHKYNGVIAKYLSERDDGVFDAMNKGLLMASGNYVLFLNAGDELASCDVLEKLERRVTEDGGTQMLYAGNVAMYLGRQFAGLADLTPWIPHQGALIKRDLLLRYKFDRSLKIFGDLDLWMRLRRDGLFQYQTLDFVVANFSLGGIGNHPGKFVYQLSDKLRLARKHKSLIIALTACAHLPVYLIGYCFHILLHKNAQNKFIHFVSSIKKRLRRSLS
jgi:glycosyltransferase involved in cell wall biosynthesis